MDPSYCADRLAALHEGRRPRSVTSLGGGFYGRVFLARYDRAPPLVIKLYRVKGMHRREAAALEVLARAALVPMPRVHRIWDEDASIPMDGLVMEYLPGENAGLVTVSDPATRAAIGESIVGNLVAYHSCVNPSGFGLIGTKSLYSDWNAYYRAVAQSHFEKAKALYDRGVIEKQVFSAAESGVKGYDQIFCLPVKAACLIHGDYNTWNVLLDGGLTRVAAVIDPAGCAWADPELDLYQLRNANGDAYGLFDRYRERRGLSENFFLKDSFYELMTELMHYHDSGVDPKPYYDKLLMQARKLHSAMAKAGIGR